MAGWDPADAGGVPTPLTIETVRSAFDAVAPEAGEVLVTLDPDADVWEALQLDSMDHLAVVERLAQAIGRDIPESDYPQLLTLAAIHRYVDGAAPGSSPTGDGSPSASAT